MTTPASNHHSLSDESVSSSSGLPCIHIGLPKTATTTLQRYLFSRHSEISYLGKYKSSGECGDYLFTAAKKLNQHLLGILKEYGFRKTLGIQPRLSPADISELRRHVEASNGAGKSSIYSQEAICELSQEKTEEFAEMLHDIFGECRILITIREPLSFTKSYYFQMLKSHNVASGRALKKYMGPAPRYFDVNEWAKLSFDYQAHPLERMLRVGEIARSYANCFGKDRVKILVFEQLKSDAEGFFDELSEFLGINFEETLQLSENQSTNMRWSEGPIDRLKQLENTVLLKWKYRFGSTRTRTKMLGLNGMVDSSAGPPMMPQYDPDVEEKILEIGRQQTQILESEWGLSLTEYGYPT
ncbi:sulfotransferase [Planctomycetaceae bacterium]|nr:sulfotransferase [Planctomycetaceae bacterium]MDB4786650.1 sulfotransferase [Planctomycetaceae bacterium]MDC0273232.1 sulfotransferase [Planctomycetaceae bacterium]